VNGVRRTATLVALLVASSAACGGAPAPAKASGPASVPLHLAPTTDLAQAASILWLIDLSPRAITSHAELLPAIETVLPHDRVASFTERNGFDPFALEELTLASYSSSVGSTTLYLARGVFDPGKLESTFRARAGALEGRAVDREGEQTIVRQWGTVHDQRAQMATFGHQVAAVEVGRFGPLRVAELFAEQRLKRASPALKAGPLARAAELLRDSTNEATAEAPARAFALGPFEGNTGQALGGLLAASTAAAVAARPETVTGHAALRVTLVLTGGWEGDAPRAADRLSAAFNALSATPLGLLAGLDRPLDRARVEPFSDALRLTVALDALGLAHGARAAMGAEVTEIMSY
jgi:hypothetical protein